MIKKCVRNNINNSFNILSNTSKKRKYKMISTISHGVANWEVTISDQGILSKANPNKLDFDSISRTCLFDSCSTIINIRRTSGLCDTHQIHQHDLLLSLVDPNGNPQSVPAHQDIIDCLIEWSKSRNYNLSAFFVVSF